MQAIYGFKQIENANFEVALDQVQKMFSDSEPDAQRAEGYTKLAHLLFEENYKNATFLQEDAPKVVYDVVINSINAYRQQVRNDRRNTELQMLTSVDKIYDLYLSVLQLLIGIAEMSVTVAGEKKIVVQEIIADARLESVFNDNRIIKALQNSQAFQNKRVRNNIVWEQAAIRKFYREVVRKNEIFMDYLKSATTDLEADIKLIEYVVKKLIFKDENLGLIFEEKDVYWVENEGTVRSMVQKTIKSVDQNGKIELSEMSKSWEEDRIFFKDLYNFTLDEDPKHETYVAEKIKNWDVDRVALTDKVMINMAIAEMLHFPSIPVKVTINEYIELAKEYSTPKSKQFINGILDAISQEFTAKKLIRKSGRGLMDNK
ncbi:MAG: transcription antitermination factor NusB [Verrucomicrobia bacterium]|nr:transcription antitermination factor NusB [Cytophagales bacterium]